MSYINPYNSPKTHFLIQQTTLLEKRIWRHKLLFWPMMWNFKTCFGYKSISWTVWDCLFPATGAACLIVPALHIMTWWKLACTMYIMHPGHFVRNIRFSWYLCCCHSIRRSCIPSDTPVQVTNLTNGLVFELNCSLFFGRLKTSWQSLDFWILTLRNLKRCINQIKKCYRLLEYKKKFTLKKCV